LQELTRELLPLDWAQAQHNLGGALMRLGEGESGTARLEQAVEAFRAALQERTRERAPLPWAMRTANQGVAMMIIADRTNGADAAEAAVQQIETACEAVRSEGPAWVPFYDAQLAKARMIRDRLKRKKP
jgi:hypothetical protein